MNRNFVIFGVLILAALGGFWAWDLTTSYLLYDIEAREKIMGWQMFKQLWPVALFGIAIGVFLIGSLVEWLIEKADQAELQDLKKSVSYYKKRSENARTDIQAELKEKYHALDDREARIEDIRVQAIISRDEALKQAEIASQEAEQAKFRARNAIFAAERLKEKARKQLVTP